MKVKGELSVGFSGSSNSPSGFSVWGIDSRLEHLGGWGQGLVFTWILAAPLFFSC